MKFWFLEKQYLESVFLKTCSFLSLLSLFTALVAQLKIIPNFNNDNHLLLLTLLSYCSSFIDLSLDPN
jgi:hypothetical protein